MRWNEQEAAFRAVASLVPEDLAELRGAVLLMHVAIEAAQAAEPPAGRVGTEEGGVTISQMLSVYAYAMGRGWVGSEEIAARCVEDGCLRYLVGRRAPEASLLRQFRRDHAALVRSSLAFLISRIQGQLDAVPRMGFDPRGESSRRFERAVAADSLAMEV